MDVKNALTTADAYSDASTLQCRGAVRLNIDVSTAGSCYYSFVPRAGGGASVKSGAFGPDRLLLPGFHNFDRRADAVRFRSGAVGVPTVVTVEALQPGEV